MNQLIKFLVASGMLFGLEHNCWGMMVEGHNGPKPPVMKVKKKVTFDKSVEAAEASKKAKKERIDQQARQELEVAAERDLVEVAVETKKPFEPEIDLREMSKVRPEFENIDLIDNSPHWNTDAGSLSQKARVVEMKKTAKIDFASELAAEKAAKLKKSEEETAAKTKAEAAAKANKPNFLARTIFPKKTPVTIKEPKFEVEKITDTDTLSLQDFNRIRDFMRNARKYAVERGLLQEHNNTLGASYDASLPDTQEINYRIRNFDRATRNVCKSILNEIKSLESKGELTFTEKRTIVENLVQKQLNTVFGTDSMTGQNKISFNESWTKELTDRILAKKEIFNKGLTSAQRLEAIAKSSDIVMNEITSGEPVNAKFDTTIDANGDYTTSMTHTVDGKTMQARTQVNVDGKEIARTLIVDNGEGQGQTTIITTTSPKTGVSRTTMIQPVPAGFDRSTLAKDKLLSVDGQFLTTTLTSAESKMTNLQYTLFKSVVLGKGMLKVALWSTKQIAWNLILQPIPQAITFGVIAPLALVAKVGATALGHSWHEKTIQATFLTVIDMTMGNRRAILSNKAGEVFTPGSMIAKSLNVVNPWGEKGGSQVNENSEYFGAEAEIGRGIMYGVKQLFPDSLGERLIAPKVLKADEAKVDKKIANTKVEAKKTVQDSLKDLQDKLNTENTEFTERAGQKDGKLKQLNRAGLEFSQDIVNTVFAQTDALTKAQNVIGSTAASLLVDTNVRIKRCAQLGMKTRNTTQTVLNMLDMAQAKKDKIGKYKVSSMLSTSEKDLAAHKKAVVEKLIQTQIDNVFGVNQLSGQSLYKLTPEVQRELQAEFSTEISELVDNPKMKREAKWQSIAKMTDAVMNRMAINGEGGKPIAIFKTTITDKGEYKTTITNEAGVSATTNIGKDGKMTQKVLTVPDEKGAPTLVFTTNIDPKTGTSTTLMNDATDITKKLTTTEDTLMQIVHDQVQAMANARSIAKALLWTGKQVVICTVALPVSTITSLCMAAIAPIVIKGGSMAVGYKWSDPVVRAALMTTIELTIGNSRGFLSNDPNRVFSKGTIGSKIVNSVKTGKISDSFAEKRDLNEEYYHSIDSAIVESSVDAYNWLFSTKKLI